MSENPTENGGENVSEDDLEEVGILNPNIPRFDSLYLADDLLITKDNYKDIY